MKLFKLMAVSLTFVTAILCTSAAFASDRNFFAFLDGFQEAPPVLTEGHGVFRARLQRDGSISFVLKVKDLEGAFAAAHIHFGQKGVNGGVMVALCGGAVACTDEVRGTITADSVFSVAKQGIDAGNLDDLIQALRSGNTYINAHTSAFGSGEIRGQVK